MRFCVEFAVPHTLGQTGKSAASQLYTTQAAVAAHVLLVSGSAPTQLDSFPAMFPSEPMQLTSRVSSDSSKPQFTGQLVKGGSVQENVTHAAVATHILVVTGLASVQLDSSAAAEFPSLPVQLTSRVRVDSPNPQVTGQSVKGGSVQENVTHSAVVAHVSAVAGLTPVQRDSAATFPFLTLRVTDCVTSDTAWPQTLGQEGKPEASQLYAKQSTVTPHVLLVAGLAPTQLDSLPAMLPSEPMQFTSRVMVDSPNPQFTGQLVKGGSVQENVTHAAVATHILVVTGLASVQLDSSAAAEFPSLPVQLTSRVRVDSPNPQVTGQSVKGGSVQENVTHSAVARHVRVVTGFAPCQAVTSEQLASSTATPSLPKQATVRVCVDAVEPHVLGQAGNAMATQP